MNPARMVPWFFLCGIGAAVIGRADVVKPGLVLYLDAAVQVEQRGKNGDNASWTNLAPEVRDGDAFQLHHLTAEPGGFAWTGAGSRHDPYALSFDGRQGYVTGPTSLEHPELTLEIWARVDDVKQGKGIAARGATLLGNDFGAGGLAFLVARDGSPVILHEREFSRVDATLPMKQWSQFVVVVRNEQGVIYVNGQPIASVAAPRTLDPEGHRGCQFGTARMPEMDYVAADGLIGAIAIVRVYDRMLSPQEVAANFQYDRRRFPIPATDRLTPVSALPAPALPGLAPAPAARALKWDYVEHPVGAQGSGSATRSPSETAARISAAFDGYPTRLDQPYPPHQWRPGPPQAEEPLYVAISYPQPVAVSRFVHYFDETPPLPAGWKDVDIQISDDLIQWRTLQQLRNLPTQSPQFLGIDQPTTARFYRIEIKSSTAATATVTNEIETWYGATIGNVLTEGDAVQSETFSFGVRLSSPDTPLKDASLVIRASEGQIAADSKITVPEVVTGSGTTVAVPLTPLVEGPLLLTLELRVGDLLIDTRPFVLVVKPKLALQDMSPSGAVIVTAGDTARLQGTVVNNGSQAANGVQVQWLGQVSARGSLAPGQAAPFELTTRAIAGYHEGLVSVTADGNARTVRRRAVLVPGGNQMEHTAGSAQTQYTSADDGVSWTARLADMDEPVKGNWHMLADETPCRLFVVPDNDTSQMLAAAIPGGVFVMRPGVEQDDAQWRCQVIPDDPSLMLATCANLDVRLAVEKPDVMFRPHLDWYTAAHGPNFPDVINAHHSATRMLCIQSGPATVSLVPDTDNLLWGFTAEHHMTARFAVPLDARARLRPDRWRPIAESPDCFTLTMPIRRGDWWAAYEHVVRDICEFEQPRQWAMPITQMQMLTTRELMSAQAWSEKHQIVRCYSNDSVFWTFYATAYSTPALYQWYLATDNETARVKAEKMIDWLLRVQHQEEPMSGAWFSAYFDQGPDEQELIGSDFIRNRWLISHATGAAVKTLLWYQGQRALWVKWASAVTPRMGESFV